MNRSERLYIASRSARAEMWGIWRKMGVNIISSWIDATGPGEIDDYETFWSRIWGEIASCDRLVLYAEPNDFPLKGALIEAGMALGMKIPVTICLPNVMLEMPSMRPIGSWIAHHLVTRNDELNFVMRGQR